jgi:hypothetical protein
MNDKGTLWRNWRPSEVTIDHILPSGIKADEPSSSTAAGRLSLNDHVTIWVGPPPGLARAP